MLDPLAALQNPLWCGILQGKLQEGEHISNVPLLNLSGSRTCLADHLPEVRPLILIAGSTFCAPFRGLVQELAMVQVPHPPFPSPSPAIPLPFNLLRCLRAAISGDHL